MGRSGRVYVLVRQTILILQILEESRDLDTVGRRLAVQLDRLDVRKCHICAGS
jgi:hypothetical protein